MSTPKPPSLDEILGITVTKEGKKWCADAKKLPGSPPVGWGMTKGEAKYDLVAKLLWLHVSASNASKGYIPIVHNKMRKALADWEAECRAARDKEMEEYEADDE
jgi:hypothetical protein